MFQSCGFAAHSAEEGRQPFPLSVLHSPVTQHKQQIQVMYFEGNKCQPSHSTVGELDGGWQWAGDQKLGRKCKKKKSKQLYNVLNILIKDPYKSLQTTSTRTHLLTGTSSLFWLSYGFETYCRSVFLHGVWRGCVNYD